MLYKKGGSEFNNFKALFTECFGEGDVLAEEILGYARDFGEIHYLIEDGKIVTMLCLAGLETGLKYLFAVATSPEYRKRGLFAKNLSLSVTENERIVCIPENKTLFPLYDKVGFIKHGYVLQANIVGDGSLLQKTTDIDLDKLYEIYKNSSFFPKKPKELFFSTIRCHLLYGGTIINDKNFYALISKSSGKSIINELCVITIDEQRIPELIKGCTVGETTINLPIKFISLLKENGIKYRNRKIFALKSEKFENNQFYINILYN
ncbi:MAG: hypothetical protein A2Y15_09710 [Clostridiales bacterium GWF2_36_10]|nr:MAG: hypothetical protein A2Y15_09710 [Clostridiales bacterium GWF2_36_10]HAN20221.1 hypothetical protein [Clostridiales bacterium]